MLAARLSYKTCCHGMAAPVTVEQTFFFANSQRESTGWEVDRRQSQSTLPSSMICSGAHFVILEKG